MESKKIGCFDTNVPRHVGINFTLSQANTCRILARFFGWTITGDKPRDPHGLYTVIIEVNDAEAWTLDITRQGKEIKESLRNLPAGTTRYTYDAMYAAFGMECEKGLRAF